MGDNLDTRVLPRNMRADHQSQSLHYFNMYAVQDRIDLSHLSNESRVIDSDDIDLGKLLPLAEDYDALRSNFVILVSRILVENMPQLSKYAVFVTKNIEHKYSSEMSTKSNVVSLPKFR